MPASEEKQPQVENEGRVSHLQTMFEISFRKCGRRLEIPERNGLYKCKCQSLAVRVKLPVTLITEF